MIKRLKSGSSAGSRHDQFKQITLVSNRTTPGIVT